ncbi:RPE1 domain containing protein [Candidatus Trichorickettsia mobilis]|uniref:RPE1 domain containing protein n=1 Tax=Candidatus Trichorickettsia mobilis TaxID=1346319 RepID=A0ABZ0UST6_9RICK|nr:palindromic element RPE1 domain-containing protein [Candidatus Trichorickettsia mobilis]WPY01084.1 RPE1 domain containing protein [Candidatus Trichorickettsia mobilis]
MGKNVEQMSLIDKINELQKLAIIDRPFSKLASERGFEGDTEHKTAAYFWVREDLSTGSTYKSSAEVEFGERSNAYDWQSMTEIRNHLTHEYPDQPEITAKYLNIMHTLTPALVQCLEKIKERIRS